MKNFHKLFFEKQILLANYLSGKLVTKEDNLKGKNGFKWKRIEKLLTEHLPEAFERIVRKLNYPHELPATLRPFF